jgi:hypothetical protein
MGFINANGENISYECSELIEELKADIKEFGGETVVAVWCKKYKGITVYTNYDFIDEDNPISKADLLEGEHIKKKTMRGLLELLEIQNEII